LQTELLELGLNVRICHNYFTVFYIFEGYRG
jgi:hypothetical protein